MSYKHQTPSLAAEGRKWSLFGRQMIFVLENIWFLRKAVDFSGETVYFLILGWEIFYVIQD